MSIDTLVSIDVTNSSSLEEICRYVKLWRYFRRTDTNVQLRTRVERCILLL